MRSPFSGRSLSQRVIPSHGYQPRRLSYDAVKTAFSRFARLARLKKKVTAHVLRHTVATTLLFNGYPIGHIRSSRAALVAG